LEKKKKKEEEKKKKNCSMIEIIVEFYYDPAVSINKRKT
jgi:hypothetical protein